MLTKENILSRARGGRKILAKIGVTKKAFYVLSKYADKYQEASQVIFRKTYKNHNLMTFRFSNCLYNFWGTTKFKDEKLQKK